MPVLAPFALAEAVPAVTKAEGWTLAWSDEFDGSDIDRTKWSLADDCWGGGNEERQCYVGSSSVASVGGGMLAITARREPHTGPAFPEDMRNGPQKAAGRATRPFISARLSTRGKEAWRYGRFAMRARLPEGQGVWPAFWMLPERNDYGPWPASGEIDILEAVNLGEACANCTGGRENGVLGTIHLGGPPPLDRHLGAATAMPAPRDGFHVYAVDWCPGTISWSIDGRIYQTRRAGEWSTGSAGNSDAPFDRRFHLVLNLAIGGHLPEGRNRGGVVTGGFPKTMAVDWVRVWQRKDGYYAGACPAIDGGKVK